MKIRTLFLAAALPLVSPAFAVDFGVMETADPIEPRHFKFIGYPLAVRDAPHREQSSGVNVGLGYGINSALDVEGQFASYDDVTYYGSDVEYSFYQGLRTDVSVSAGMHYGDSDFGDVWGLDWTHIASYSLPRLPAMTLNGALDIAYDDLDRNGNSAAASFEDEYFTVYLVPGLQYRINHNIDIVGEAGIGLNEDSNEYASAGVSYYFR